jgi:uncharacterized protein
MIAGFFGDRRRQRFCAYHEPTGVGRPRAVLLCNPGPQEYRQCHFVLRQLADRLVEHGLHVLRFDYIGTGDSSGDASDGSLAHWTDDVEEAATELRERSGVSRLSIVGIRLGAAIAARAVGRGLRVQDLILWDPVVNGSRYLAHLRAVQQRIRLDQPYPISDREEPGSLLGIPMTEDQRLETAALDLLLEPLELRGKVAVFTAEPSSEAERLVARWSDAGVDATHEVVPDATLARPVWHQDTLLARSMPAAITARLTGGTA